MSLGSWMKKLFGGPPASLAVPSSNGTAIREGWFAELLSETHFLERWPEYAGILARMDPVATNTVTVMAVTLRQSDDPRSRIQLLVNLDWLQEHRDDVTGVLLHEIQHIVLGHLTNPRLHAVVYPKIMEIAMEISADETIPIPVPDHGFSMKRFAKYGIRPGQSSLERYQLLATAYDRGDLRMEEFWQARTRDNHRPRQDAGMPGAGIGDLLDARSDQGTAKRWQQDRWQRGAPSSARALERMKLEIARHLRGERGGQDDPLTSTQRRVAKELERIVFDRGEGPLLLWRRILNEAFPKKRQVRPDYLRPNRRFPARVGEIPGRARRVPRPAVLVGIDTSGSMTGATLDRVARELRHLATFARLTIVECDAVVHRIYPFAGKLGPFIGGGDTDFGPLFHEADLHRDAEGLVLFTDGKGQMPDRAPTIPTLWVLTHDDPFLADWGSIVRMP